jgi:hypothetical protein
LASDRIGLTQPDVEQRAGLNRALARRRDGDDAAGGDFDRLEIRVRDAAAFLAVRLAHVGHVRVHDQQVAGVHAAEVVPLREHDAPVAHQRRRDAVREVARAEDLVRAIGADGAGLGRSAPVVLVAELRLAGLDDRSGHEHDAIRRKKNRHHVVAHRVGRQLLDLARDHVVHEQAIALVAGQPGRHHDAARVEVEVVSGDVRVGELRQVIAAQHLESAVG